MSDETIPQSSSAWRCPFQVGWRYRVRRDFQALRDAFRAGEVLTFASSAYSHYHEYCGYFFSQADAENLRIWDLHDDEELAVWQEFFEELPS